MNAEKMIEFLSDENTFFAIIGALDNLTNGCRIRITPQEEMRYSFVWVLNEMLFCVTSDDSGTVGRSLGWLTSNSNRIYAEMCATSLVEPYWSLPERVRWVTALCAEVVRRNSVNPSRRSASLKQGQDQE